MSAPISITITRDDGTTVRLPSELWSGVADYREWGLYVAVACWANGAPLKDLLWFSASSPISGVMAALHHLVDSGHLVHHLGSNGGRYFAQGLEVIA